MNVNTKPPPPYRVGEECRVGVPHLLLTYVPPNNPHPHSLLPHTHSLLTQPCIYLIPTPFFSSPSPSSSSTSSSSPLHNHNLPSPPTRHLPKLRSVQPVRGIIKNPKLRQFPVDIFELAIFWNIVEYIYIYIEIAFETSFLERSVVL